MDYAVCPRDGIQVLVVEVRWGPEQEPLVRCPRCGTRYVLHGDGLQEVAP
ncbi:hypothetical protein [Kineococcus rubinsiae]|nr:hypothetical protein [Kineococcus rubinsiae]